MFSKFLGSTIFKKFVGASILAILVATLAPTAAHAFVNPAPMISGTYTSPDIGSVVSVNGAGFNGVSATIGGVPATVSNETPTSFDLTVPAFTGVTYPLTSVAKTLVVTNADTQQSNVSSINYSASTPTSALPLTPYFSAPAGGGQINLVSTTGCAPLNCNFFPGATATISFGNTTTLLPISVTSSTTATITLPAHAMVSANTSDPLDTGKVVVLNPNNWSDVFYVTYYAAPTLAFSTPGTSLSPNTYAVGTPMSVSTNAATGFCKNYTASADNVIQGVKWTWDAATQIGTLSGTPTTDMSTPTAFTAICSNPVGTSPNAVIYLQSYKLQQTVDTFTLSGATLTSTNHYSTTFGASGLTFSYTTTPSTGGGAVTVSTNDACVTADSVAKTISITCVPAGDVTLSAVAQAPTNGIYKDSLPKTITLTVNKATQTIPTLTVVGATGSGSSYSASFGTTGLSYAFTTNPVGVAGNVTVSSSDPTCVTLGSSNSITINCVPVNPVTLEAKLLDSNNYIGPVTKTATLSITKGQLGVTFAPILQMISGGPAQDLSMNAAITPTGIGSPYVISYSVAPASSTVCSLNGTNHTLTALAEGNCVVTANVAGDGNMLAAVAQTRTIVVKLAAAQVITYSGISATYVYGNADVTFHVTDLFGDAIQVSNILTTTATLTQLNATTYTMHIVQAGNGTFSAYDPLTKTRTDFSFVVSPKPVTLAPSMASVAANGTVTFDPIAIVGLLPGDFVQVDASQVVGSYSATGLLSWTGAFKLTGSAAQNYTIAAQPLSFAVHPVIFNVTPAFGSPVGGNTITITGAGFTPTAQVSFGTSVAASVHYVSSSTLQVVTPAHAVGTTSIVVAMNGLGSVSSPVNFEFKPLAPVINSVTPGTSVITGGTVIQIVGENFAPDITVTLDGAPIGVQSVTPHELTFSTPAHAAGAVKLVIANPGLPSVTWTSDLVYILPISVTPPSVTKAWTSGGLKVTVSGENFAAGVTVTVQGIAATNVLVVDPKTLSFFLPAVTNTGLADIVIKTAENQTITLPGAVNFVATPTSKMTFGAATTVTSKGLKALKRFVTQVKKAGLKLTTLQVSIYAKSSTPTAAEAKAAKLFAKAVRSALTRLGLRVRGTNLVSGASGAMKNSVIITGN